MAIKLRREAFGKRSDRIVDKDYRYALSNVLCYESKSEHSHTHTLLSSSVTLMEVSKRKYNNYGGDFDV